MSLQSLLVSSIDGSVIPITLTPDVSKGYTVQMTPASVEKTAKLPCWGKIPINLGGTGGASPAS